MAGLEEFVQKGVNEPLPMEEGLKMKALYRLFQNAMLYVIKRSYGLALILHGVDDF